MNNLEVIHSYEALMDKVEESLGPNFRAKGLHLDTLNHKNIVCIELTHETSFDIYTLEIEKYDWRFLDNHRNEVFKEITGLQEVIGELTEWFFPKELFGEEKMSYDEYISLGNTNFEGGEYKEALNYYTRALKLDKYSELAEKRIDECVRKLVDLEYVSVQKDLKYLFEETQRHQPDLTIFYNGLDMIKRRIERIQNKNFV